jgi:hypothetical protein
LPFLVATKTFWLPQKGGPSYVFGNPSSWWSKIFSCHWIVVVFRMATKNI